MGDRWCARIERAKQKGGIVIDHLPLVSNRLPLRPVNITSDITHLVVSEQQLVCAMVERGLLSPAEAENVQSASGARNEPPSAASLARPSEHGPFAEGAALQYQKEITLRPETSIFFEHSIAAGLAQSAALERLASFCHVVIDQEDADMITADAKLYEQNLQLKRWVTDLLSHLSNGIDSGKYRTHLHPAPNLPQERTEIFRPEELCLYDAAHHAQKT